MRPRHGDRRRAKPPATTFNRRNEFMAAPKGRAGKDCWNLAEQSPRTALILPLTRRYSSGLLNLAAHLPEEANATEIPILGTSNGPGRTDSLVQRRFRVRSP
jgi:hypothetical protein